MAKCKICNRAFDEIIGRHYISRDEGRTGIAAISGGPECKEYDTFDCPWCGCQYIAKERKRAILKSNSEKT